MWQPHFNMGTGRGLCRRYLRTSDGSADLFQSLWMCPAPIYLSWHSLSSLELPQTPFPAGHRIALFLPSSSCFNILNFIPESFWLCHYTHHRYLLKFYCTFLLFKLWTVIHILTRHYNSWSTSVLSTLYNLGKVLKVLEAWVEVIYDVLLLRGNEYRK